MIKTCVICGKQFGARTKAKTCSKECSDLLRARNNIKSANAANERKRQQRQIQSGWLTIPDAPNYEINSDLQVRNKITGRFLKLSIKKRGANYYQLWQNTVTGKVIARKPESLLMQARAALAVTNFAPLLPPFDLYEVDKRGRCRNRLTKKLLQCRNSNQYSLHNQLTKKTCSRSVNDLLWETHGQKKSGFRRVPVWAEHPSGKFYFTTCIACARFLKDILHYSLQTLITYFKKRKPTIGDWKFTYLVDDEPQWNKHALNSEARRQKRVWGSS